MLNDLWARMYRAFNPLAPVSTEEAERLYAPRPGRIAERLGSAIRREEGTKGLLAGQRGSGKTMELRHLAHLMGESHLVCWLDVESRLDIFSVEHLEVLVAAVAVMYATAGKGDQGPLDQIGGILTRLGGGLEISGGKLLEMAGLPQFKLGIHWDPRRRIEAEPAIADVLAETARAIEKVQEACERPVLWIVDGLDKMEPAQARRIFAESSLLTRFPCAAVYTVAFELFHSPELTAVRRYFTEAATLEVPLLSTSESLDHFDELARRRARQAGAPDDFIPQDVVVFLSAASGGVPGHFVQLVRLAASEQPAGGAQPPNLTMDLAQAAANRLASEMHGGLDQRLMEYLCRVWRPRPPLLPDDFPEGERERLLSNLYILHHVEPGQPPRGRFTVHPLLEPYLEEECPPLTPPQSR